FRGSRVVWLSQCQTILCRNDKAHNIPAIGRFVTEQATPTPETRQGPKGSMPALALTALGIVFGDIGTSPLYTFKTVLGTTDTPSDPATVLGALSLVLWTLFIVTTAKYVSFAMRVDNDGEGGILALMALLGV